MTAEVPSLAYRPRCVDEVARETRARAPQARSRPRDRGRRRGLSASSANEPGNKHRLPSGRIETTNQLGGAISCPPCRDEASSNQFTEAPLSLSHRGRVSGVELVAS